MKLNQEEAARRYSELKRIGIIGAEEGEGPRRRGEGEEEQKLLQSFELLAKSIEERALYQELKGKRE
jgi:hypothetical protein